MVNAADLKSAAAKAACGFEPHSRHWELLVNPAAWPIGARRGRAVAGTIWVLPAGETGPVQLGQLASLRDAWWANDPS